MPGYSFHNIKYRDAWPILLLIWICVATEVSLLNYLRIMERDIATYSLHQILGAETLGFIFLHLWVFILIVVFNHLVKRSPGWSVYIAIHTGLALLFAGGRTVWNIYITSELGWNNFGSIELWTNFWQHLDERILMYVIMASGIVAISFIGKIRKVNDEETELRISIFEKKHQLKGYHRDASFINFILSQVQERAHHSTEEAHRLLMNLSNYLRSVFARSRSTVDSESDFVTLMELVSIYNILLPDPIEVKAEPGDGNWEYSLPVSIYFNIADSFMHIRRIIYRPRKDQRELEIEFLNSNDCSEYENRVSSLTSFMDETVHFQRLRNKNKLILRLT